MDVDAIDVAHLDMPAQLPDLRRDIHVFVDHVRDHDIKRMHRDNGLPKADAKRLAKLLSDPKAPAEVDESGYSSWVNYVDRVTWQLGFVKYDTKGEYAGYTSAAPSFPDNYIEFQERPYQQFLALNPAQQETRLLELLLAEGQGSQSEFYATPVLGRLDRFSQWGAATGVVPALEFPAVRRFLLNLLAACPPDRWLSTASLIAYLKANHRYFLIPKKLPFKSKWDEKQGRYGNFHEGKQAWGNEIAIHAHDADAFERVEGRYVERFLEGLPLLLRYVDVAYATKRSPALHPSLGTLKAFRVNGRLPRALHGEIGEPQVTVTPSFDVYVQAETYPASVLAALVPVCELVQADTSFVLKLTKQKVAAARAANPKLDVVALLERWASKELPANVVRELAAWSEHGEKFVLYADGAVLEADPDLSAADPFTLASIAPGIRLVHSPGKLFDVLERQELVPWRVKHGDAAFSPLPKHARSRFPKQSATPDKPRVTRQRVRLVRVTRVKLVCPDSEFLDRLHRALLAAQCLVEIDRKHLTLTYAKASEPEVTAALRSLKSDYQITIDDAGPERA